jgi:hypothetical protein
MAIALASVFGVQEAVAKSSKHHSNSSSKKHHKTNMKKTNMKKTSAVTRVTPTA